jgi:hypothetical protein
LVLRSPVIRSPSFHCPRFLSNSRRSKRFSTFLLPPNVAAARRLRCCDITQIRFCVLFSAAPEPKRTLYVACRLPSAKVNFVGEFGSAGVAAGLQPAVDQNFFAQAERALGCVSQFPGGGTPPSTAGETPAVR